MLVACFSVSLLFSSIHHLVEVHHHHDEECVAAEMGEVHLHGWEFEECDFCDLQIHQNFIKHQSLTYRFVELIVKPYFLEYTPGFSSEQILAFSNRGPPTIS